MLNNFIQPASISTGQAVEGIQPIQAFAPYNQFSHLIPTFELADDGSKAEDEEKKSEKLVLQNKDQEEEQIPDLFRLAMNVSFKEMLEYFLVPGHDKVLDIRNQIRKDRGVDQLTIIAPSGKIPENFDPVRNHLYQIQMQLFQTPKGLHCHVIFE